MAPYLFGVRNGVHIIDLTQTVPMLHRALEATREVAAAGGRILFVGTKRQAQEPVTRAASRSRPVLRQPSLARRHADQLEDHLPVDPPPARARGPDRRRHPGPDQEGDAAADPPARQAGARARRHQGHGRPARPAVRDRHQQGIDRGRRSPNAGHPGGGGGRQQLRAGQRHLPGARATTMPRARSISTAISWSAPCSTASRPRWRPRAPTSARSRSCRRSLSPSATARRSARPYDGDGEEIPELPAAPAPSEAAGETTSEH